SRVSEHYQWSIAARIWGTGRAKDYGRKLGQFVHQSVEAYSVGEKTIVSKKTVHISDLKLTKVAVPFATTERWAWGGLDGLANVVIEMQTDEGLVGLGEAPGHPTPEIVVDTILSLLPL